MAANNAINNHVFYDNVTTTDETSTCILTINNNASTLNLEFITTGTFSAQIYAGIFDKDHLKPWPALKMSSIDPITSTISDGNYFYEVDVTALDYVKVVLTALTGNLTVRAKVVG